AARGGARVAQLGLTDVLGRRETVGQVEVGVELDARLGLRGGQLPDPFAVLLYGDLAARAPDEAGHGRRVVGRRAQSVGAGELGHQLLRDGDELGPAGRRGADARGLELVGAVPDAAHAAEPRDRVDRPALRVVGEHAGDYVGLVGPGVHVGRDVGEHAERRLGGRVGVAEFGDVGGVLAAGERVGPVLGAVRPGDEHDLDLGLGVGRILLVELADHAV